MNRDRLIRAACYLTAAIGIFLMGVNTGKWLDSPAVTVTGIRMEVSRDGPPPPTATPLVGLPY